MSYLPEGDDIIHFIYGTDDMRSKERLASLASSYFTDLKDPNVSVIEDSYDLSKLTMEINSMPFLASRRLVLIKNILKAKGLDQAKIINIIDKAPKEVDLIFFEQGVPDQRTALFKRLKKEKTEIFSDLMGYELNRWVTDEVEKQGGSVSPQDASVLAGYIGPDLWRLKNEIAKLVAFDKNITRENIDQLVDAGVDVGIFNLLDAITAKNKSKAIKNLGDLLDKGENEIFILTMIQKQIHNLALVFEKRAKSVTEGQIAQDLKLHPFVVKKALGALRQVRDIATIKRYFKYVTEAEYEIKTGQKDPAVALELLVINLSK